MRFIPLGVGDAFSAFFYSSCLALEYDGQWLLIDCPHPIRKMMREAVGIQGNKLDINNFLGAVITHLHADHCSGIEGFGYASHFGLHKKATLVMHTRVLDNLWNNHLAAGMQFLMDEEHEVHYKELRDYFDIIQFDEKDHAQIGPFSIYCRRTIHHIYTTALIVSAGGKSIGISADTCFDPELIKWLSSADLVIHETNYGIHTPYEKLAALPVELRSKMRLIHYPDDFDVTTSVIEPLRQGILYNV